MKLALYHFDGCPFCIRVRMAIDDLGVDIELRNTLENPEYGAEVVANTGRRTVPVLRIEDETGDVTWMPESADIIRYLQAHHAAAS